MKKLLFIYTLFFSPIVLASTDNIQIQHIAIIMTGITIAGLICILTGASWGVCETFFKWISGCWVREKRCCKFEYCPDSSSSYMVSYHVALFEQFLEWCSNYNIDKLKVVHPAVKTKYKVKERAGIRRIQYDILNINVSFNGIQNDTIREVLHSPIAYNCKFTGLCRMTVFHESDKILKVETLKINELFAIESVKQQESELAFTIKKITKA